MKVSARVQNRAGQHEVRVRTNEVSELLTIRPRTDGRGSSVNGGELLCLALATCYCNDVYREAANRGITVESVEVTVDGEFGAAGEGASSLTYDVSIAARASEDEIRTLARETDRVAEIHNTIRNGSVVALGSVEVRSVNLES